MSTLTEIEAAVVGLPVQEKRSLLTWLEGQLRIVGDGPLSPGAERCAWLEELAALRRQMSTDRHGCELQEILDDLREGR